MTDTAKLLAMFSPASSWSTPMCRENGLRLLRRWAADGTRDGYSACHDLLKTAPAEHQIAALEAVRDGLSERSQGFEEITQGGLFDKQATEASTGVKRSRRDVCSSRRSSSAPRFSSIGARIRPTIWHWNLLCAPVAMKRTIRSSNISPTRRSSERAAEIAPLVARIRPRRRCSRGPADCGWRHAGRKSCRPRLDVLARFDEPADNRPLIAGILASSADRRAAVRDVLFAEAGPCPCLSPARRPRRVLDAQEVPVDQLRHLANHHSNPIDALVRKHWGNLGPGPTEERLATMRRFQQRPAGRRRKPRCRQDLFKNTAQRATNFTAKGENIGPDLTIANRQDQAALLANIVDPSAVIRREYIAYIVVTTSGRVITGLIAEQDAASVTLITAESQADQSSRATKSTKSPNRTFRKCRRKFWKRSVPKNSATCLVTCKSKRNSRW